MPRRGTALQARFLMASRFWNRRPRAWPRPSFLAAAKKFWDQSSRLALHPRPRRPLIPSTPAQRLGVLFAHSPNHVSFPSMAAAPARAASVSRIAQRSLASRPAHSRGHPYVTRYPKASAITTQRKISAPARYACGTQCLVLRPCCTLKQQGLRRRAWAAHGRRIVPWRGTTLQAPNPPDAGGN